MENGEKNAQCTHIMYIYLKFLCDNFQDGNIEELSTWFYLDTAILKSSESLLSET